MSTDVFMTVGEHLDELRRRLLVVVVIGVSSFCLALLFSSSVLSWIISNVGFTIVVSSPTEILSSMVYVSILLSSIIFLPVILYELFAYSYPIIPQHKRNSILRWMLCSVVLTIIGAALGYFLSDSTISYMGTLGASVGAINLWSVDSVVNFYVYSMFMMGMVFQIPLLMSFTTRIGIVSKSFYLKYRSMILFASIVVAAIVSPQTDVLSLLYVAAPITGLYHVGLLWN